MHYFEWTFKSPSCSGPSETLFSPSRTTSIHKTPLPQSTDPNTTALPAQPSRLRLQSLRKSVPTPFPKPKGKLGHLLPHPTPKHSSLMALGTNHHRHWEPGSPTGPCAPGEETPTHRWGPVPTSTPGPVLVLSKHVWNEWANPWRNYRI